MSSIIGDGLQAHHLWPQSEQPSEPLVLGKHTGWGVGWVECHDVTTNINTDGLLSEPQPPLMEPMKGSTLLRLLGSFRLVSDPPGIVRFIL